jgi:hypothetical protein
MTILDQTSLEEFRKHSVFSGYDDAGSKLLREFGQHSVFREYEDFGSKVTQPI